MSQSLGKSANRTNGWRRVPKSFDWSVLWPLILLRALQHLVEADVHVWLGSGGATLGVIWIVGHGGRRSEVATAYGRREVSGVWK